MFSTDLTKYERKQAFETIIKLGNDVSSQKHQLNKISSNIIESHLSAASDIIISQDRISENIESLNYNLSNIEDGIENLRSSFEWGMSNVVWQLELNRKELKNIQSVLEAPLDTQAKERRKRAVDAYLNGWIEEAEEEFIESEKLNKFDFTLQISLGMIYLNFKGDTHKSLEYFEKAIKYAKPKSPLHASYALLYKGQIKHSLGLTQEAAYCTKEAIDLSPKFSEALYQNAQYNSLLGNTQIFIDSLEKSIRLDRFYCAKALNDKSFESKNDDIQALIKKLTDEACLIAAKKHNEILSKLKLVLAKIVETEVVDGIEIEKIEGMVDKIHQLILTNKYLDVLDAIQILEILEYEVKYLCQSVVNKINSMVSSIETKNNQLKHLIEKDISEQTEKLKSDADVNKKVARILLIIGIIAIGAYVNSFVLIILGVCTIVFLTSVMFTGSYTHSQKYLKLIEEKLNNNNNIDKLGEIKNYIDSANVGTPTNNNNIKLPKSNNYITENVLPNFVKHCLRCSKKYEKHVDICDECLIELDFIKI
jgi:tetratricopeptide (TPR) repeat protein